MKSLLIRCAAGAILSAVAASSNAGLIVEMDSAKTLSPPNVLQSFPVVIDRILTHVGEFDANVQRVKDKNANVPLGRALMAIVPAGWSGYIEDQRVKQVGMVSFSGDNRPWPIVLEDLLAANNLVGVINWSKKELTLKPGQNFVSAQ